MTLNDGLIVLAAVVLTALLGWYFFGPKKSRKADLEDGVQVVRVGVKGGYSPDLVEVRAGVPVRMLFDRQETGECTSRVVIPGFRINQLLPAHATTAVEFLPDAEGDYRFACGMNMVDGRVRVVGGRTEDLPAAVTAATLTAEPPAGHRHGKPDRPLPGSDTDWADRRGPSVSAAPPFGGLGGDDAEAREREAEIKDLTGRVFVGTVLSLPVVAAVMLEEVFGLHWMPDA